MNDTKNKTQQLGGSESSGQGQVRDSVLFLVVSNG